MKINIHLIHFQMIHKILDYYKNKIKINLFKVLKINIIITILNKQIKLIILIQINNNLIQIINQNQMFFNFQNNQNYRQ
jgi:hypothetical protein